MDSHKKQFFALSVVTFLLLETCISIPGFSEEMLNTPNETLLHERVLYQSFDIPGTGQKTPKLEVTIYTPEGVGPFPVVVMNHGTATSRDSHAMSRFRVSYAIWYFLSRGYVVALPMMRGYANSEGRQNPSGCNQVFTGLSNASDILAVLAYMARQPNIDTLHMLIAGHSMGGWNTLAAGSLAGNKIKGLVNFMGGLRNSTCPTNEQILANGAIRYAQTTLAPSIWIYGQNDSVFPPQYWQSMYQNYIAAGGKAQLIDVDTFFIDSHHLLSRLEGLPLWAPKVDAFLASIGMPHQLLDARYLPTPFPSESGYANVADVDAVPYITEDGVKQYQQFLKSDKPRVFLVNPKHSLFTSGGFDPLGRALEFCKQKNEQCQIYAVDDVVTWVRPTPSPPTTDFADIGKSSVIPFIGNQGRNAYEQYLRERPPKAFAIASDGGYALAWRNDNSIARALELCGEKHADCQLYAVDQRVVWAGKTQLNKATSSTERIEQ